MASNDNVEDVVLMEVPRQINDSEILYFLYTKDVNYKHVNAIKQLTNLNDETISGWLNINVKTLCKYLKPGSTFKGNVKEHILLILTLFCHGFEVFKSKHAFESWLNTPNFYFFHKQPSAFLKTVTGIHFVNDRLTALEYGDNV